MRQSPTLSAPEAFPNVVMGYTLAVCAQLAVIPVFGFAVVPPHPTGIGMVISGLALVRMLGPQPPVAGGS